MDGPTSCLCGSTLATVGGVSNGRNYCKWLRFPALSSTSTVLHPSLHVANLFIGTVTFEIQIESEGLQPFLKSLLCRLRPEAAADEWDDSEKQCGGKLTDARYDVWCMSTALSHWTMRTALREKTGVSGLALDPDRLHFCACDVCETKTSNSSWDLRERMPLEPPRELH